jgi:hypothetical protein
LLPQHLTALSAVTAQAEVHPTETALMPVPRLVKAIGEGEQGADPHTDLPVSLPSSPNELLPQHWTAPSVVTAHADDVPTDTEVADKPATFCGMAVE